MRYLLVLLTMISWAVPSLAQTNPYWNEDTAFRLETVGLKFDGSTEIFSIRLSNLGPDALYFFSRIGTSYPASISVEKLVDGKWQDVRIIGDVRARCSSPLVKGDSVTVPVSVDSQALLEEGKPAKVRFGLLVYRSSQDCIQRKNGRFVSSFPEVYANTR